MRHPILIAQHHFTSKFSKPTSHHPVGTQEIFVALEICQANFPLTPRAIHHVGETMIRSLRNFISISVCAQICTWTCHNMCSTIHSAFKLYLLDPQAILFFVLFHLPGWDPFTTAFPPARPLSHDAEFFLVPENVRVVHNFAAPVAWDISSRIPIRLAVGCHAEYFGFIFRTSLELLRGLVRTRGGQSVC